MKRPDCHCFGQLHSEPAGRHALPRNLVLAALAAFVAGGQPTCNGTMCVRT